jgi:hypothetical protein
MENINTILGREEIANQIKNILNNFDKNCKNVSYNKGIYIYGASGTGKTHFIMKLLEEMDYDIIRYDAGDVRNTSMIDTITSNNMACRNVLHMMNKSVKKIIIVMDEIDGMNSGDKGGLTSLIKLIRQKKTKKQKLEDVTLNPIICIGNYFLDKKMKELMKVCTAFELKTPTPQQMSLLLNNTMKNENENKNENIEKGTARLKSMVLEYIQGDLRKLKFIQQLNPDILNETFIENILHIKSHNEDSKKITKHLINQPMSLSEHATFINETDRTIVALLWHENIIDALDKHPPQKTYPFYLRILDNMCFADYIDRITFQYQIWQFNEMSSLMKTFYNNNIYHETFQNKAKLDEVRFTKVLTKYSTEYNNQQFIYGMCQDLDMDKKDLIAFFQELRIYYGENFQSQAEILNQVEESFENNNVSKLDIKRMYRYLDKNVKKTIADDESVTDE